jgi:hypothetical protein
VVSTGTCVELLFSLQANSMSRRLHHVQCIKACRVTTAIQVHRAVLKDTSSHTFPVIVKVRHPGVAACIARDFRLLKPLAGG